MIGMLTAPTIVSTAHARSARRGSSIALRSAIEDPRRADRACALLALVGAINVPIIYFSVQWWNTLHQGSSISLTVAPRMAMVMLAGILIMTAAAWCYTIAITLARMQTIIIERVTPAAPPEKSVVAAR